MELHFRLPITTKYPLAGDMYKVQTISSKNNKSVFPPINFLNFETIEREVEYIYEISNHLS